MYLGVDIQGMGRVTEREVTEVYRKELMKISNVGKFMGICKSIKHAKSSEDPWVQFTLKEPTHLLGMT